MFKKITSLLLFLILYTGIALSVHMDDSIIIKNNVDMRDGPGSYYGLILRLKPDAEVTKIGQEQQWLKVKFKDEVGWIPERAAYLNKKKQSVDDKDEIDQNAQSAFDQLSEKSSDDENDPYASPAQVAAAVKGFAKDFTARRKGNKNVDLLKNFNNFVNPAEYHRFRRVRLRNWTWQKAQSRFSLKTREAPALNPQREQVGWAIANVVAQKGLINDRPLQQYLTYIALVVAENTQRYEIPVQVYILDTDEITGYGCPNGAIFVSKGVLKLMQSESEFAFFAAHELAHIVLNHGVKETKKRQAKILAEKRFEELDQEMNPEKQHYKDVEEELTEWANQVYEYTVRDRLKQYEYEADYWAVAYTYRAGYNPRAGLNLLQRIYNKRGDYENKIGKAIWKGTSLRDRIIKINSQIDDLDIPKSFGHSYQSTFQHKMRSLDK